MPNSLFIVYQSFNKEHVETIRSAGFNYHLRILVLKSKSNLKSGDNLRRTIKRNDLQAVGVYPLNCVK